MFCSILKSLGLYQTEKSPIVPLTNSSYRVIKWLHLVVNNLFVADRMAQRIQRKNS